MLPELIEIIPLREPVTASVTVPGSKSVTNRALVLAALADGPRTLCGALWSEDTQVMVDALRTLGFSVSVENDASDPCNRTIVVEGLNGRIPNYGEEARPLELFVGNAGTAARFLAALVCLGTGVYRLHGVPRMHERPQGALFQALRDLGYRVDARDDRLPATIHGSGPNSGSCSVGIGQSSQFASALLLCAPTGGWRVSIADESADEAPYVSMTEQLIRTFPQSGERFQIEPDASGGSYFWAAGWLLGGPGSISVPHWPESGWQIDARFPNSLPLPERVSRRTDLGDSIMTAIVLAPFAERSTHFCDLGRLRLQECERVEALRMELSRCGASVKEEGDTLVVDPSPLHGAEIETYHDHRMAMCFSILALKTPGIKIKNPACVKKTFPGFYQKLNAAPPHGLGAVILDASSREPLTGRRLFAD
ncbi:MAG: 3-phosphoshikimate 1-carboxyvinyltransferase [Verrucomicrobia bacterium]|jgi:3-phosphoshikimate 1-carboxyvinyltransferase|nr:3-phosphoshikimate 1-carboxyvinyltransferase [Verrucomicrobiota bacterium]